MKSAIPSLEEFVVEEDDDGVEEGTLVAWQLHKMTLIQSANTLGKSGISLCELMKVKLKMKRMNKIV